LWVLRNHKDAKYRTIVDTRLGRARTGNKNAESDSNNNLECGCLFVLDQNQVIFDMTLFLTENLACHILSLCYLSPHEHVVFEIPKASHFQDDFFLRANENVVFGIPKASHFQDDSF
jgi:hypothetical protein